MSFQFQKAIVIFVIIASIKMVAECEEKTAFFRIIPKADEKISYTSYDADNKPLQGSGPFKVVFSTEVTSVYVKNHDGLDVKI